MKRSNEMKPGKRPARQRARREPPAASEPTTGEDPRPAPHRAAEPAPQPGTVPPAVPALSPVLPPAAPVASASSAAPSAPAAAVLPLQDPEPQLVVSVSGLCYAIPIMGIEEILAMREVAPLPRSAPAVRGVLFLRGHPVTVVDLSVLLGGTPARGARIVVLSLEGERYGLVVDQVLKVVEPEALQNAAPPPAALRTPAAVRGVARLGGEVITLLDLERLLPTAQVVRTGS